MSSLDFRVEMAARDSPGGSRTRYFSTAFGFGSLRLPVAHRLLFLFATKLEACKEMIEMHREDVAEIGKESPLALRILDYLRRHPQAKDSVEGIAQFWVSADPIEVRRALDRLVDMKLVEKRASASMDLYSMSDDSLVAAD
jgi:hypothetical protein